MSPSLRSVLRAALAGAIAATMASPAPAADKVAVGTGGSASDAPFYIAYDKGFFKDELSNDGLHPNVQGYAVMNPLAETAIAAGWFVSFSGIVTFKKWSDDEIIRLVPDERILAESDSPYLAPVPHRGKRNEPAWVSFTVARLGDARGVSAESMGNTVAANARRLFKLAS